MSLLPPMVSSLKLILYRLTREKKKHSFASKNIFILDFSSQNSKLVSALR